MLTLQPDTFLLALTTGAEALATLTLINNTSHTLAYKIKANCAVKINNPLQAISPFSCAEVEVLVPSDQNDAQLKVLSTPMTAEVQWKQAAKQVLRLRVLHITTRRSPLPCKVQGNLQDTKKLISDLLVSTAALLAKVEDARKRVEEARMKKPVESTGSCIHYCAGFAAGVLVTCVASALT